MLCTISNNENREQKNKLLNLLIDHRKQSYIDCLLIRETCEFKIEKQDLSLDTSTIKSVYPKHFNLIKLA